MSEKTGTVCLLPCPFLRLSNLYDSMYYNKTIRLKEGMKMKLRTARFILLGFCLLMVILIVIGSTAASRVIGGLGIASAFLGALFWIIFGRCPSCGKYLGRANEKYCPHCGDRIEW